MLHFDRTVALLLASACLLVTQPPVAAQDSVLFDASHRENAGNADWIIDADSFDLNQPHYPCGPSDFEDESRAQRFPTPPASGILPTTDESYWTGGISAFGVDLVKAGFAVESLPPGGSISFGDGANPQDLTNYDVFVLPEPNLPFTASETLAIRDFVAAGGGLFLIADHQTSDRDCDGSDSPHILNDLMGVVVGGGQITDYGLLGIVFNVEEIAGQTSADYWFTDSVDDNVTSDPTDPIIHGPHGDGGGGLGLFGSTAMTIDPASNAPGAADPLCGNGTDTDHNANDFAVLGTADPQNSVDPAEPPCLTLGNVGESLYFDNPGKLYWAAALGAVDYKVRRATDVEFMLTHPAPDDTHLLQRTSATTLVDSDEPASGAVYYYFVTGADGVNGESPD